MRSVTARKTRDRTFKGFRDNPSIDPIMGTNDPFSEEANRAVHDSGHPISDHTMEDPRYNDRKELEQQVKELEDALHRADSERLEAEIQQGLAEGHADELEHHLKYFMAWTVMVEVTEFLDYLNSTVGADPEMIFAAFEVFADPATPMMLNTDSDLAELIVDQYDGFGS